MKLQLEFIHDRRTPWAAIVVGLAGALLCAGALIQWRLAYVDEQQQRDTLVMLEQAIKEQKGAIQQQKSHVDPAEMQRAAAQEKMLRILRYAWNRVLAPIEQADSTDVALLSLTHEQSSGITQLQVEAASAAALGTYVDKLNAGSEGGGDVWYLSSFLAQPQNNPPTVKGTVLLVPASSKR